jgi:3-oxoacyl-[acyl-carrier protein] reductase
MSTATDWLSLRGRTALVTGASQGIGAEIARLFAHRGATVVANHKVGVELPGDLRDCDRVVAMPADIADPVAVAEMFETCARHRLAVDVLVNNAGVFPRQDPLTLEPHEWDAVLDINLRGAFLCIRAAAVQMIALGRGHIVNISSDAANKGPPKGAHYAASKAGLIALTRSLARRLGPQGVRVNAIAPGVTDTAQPNLSDTERKRKAAEIPLGRVGRPEDVAKAALFLVTPLSEYITGQVLYVNGGAFLA